MAFVRPTLAELVERVRADIRGRLSLSGSLLRRAMADVLATVWAGAVHMQHGHLAWTAEQLIPTTSERAALLEQAAMWGITPSPATFATGTIFASGTNGSTIDEDSIIVRADGIQYHTTAAAVIASGFADIPVEAVLAGSSGNVVAGEDMTFESPIAGVDSGIEVNVPGIGGGFDEEHTEGTRDRFLLRLREPPTGGSDQDYEAWALAVAGVTRAWVYPVEDGLGTVVVRFVLDDEVDIFPDAPTVAAVQAALDSERPITAEVTAEAPTPLEVDFTIELEPDTAAIRTAVEAELADLLTREAEPGSAIDATRGVILLSHIRTAIGVAEGVVDYVMTVPAADVEPAAGELAIVGTVTWV